MKTILLLICALFLVGCGDDSGGATYLKDGEMCLPDRIVAVHCSYDCTTGLYVQDEVHDDMALRTYFETEKFCNLPLTPIDQTWIDIRGWRYE